LVTVAGAPPLALADELPPPVVLAGVDGELDELLQAVAANAVAASNAPTA
jgi:hypothetical protein